MARRLGVSLHNGEDVDLGGKEREETESTCGKSVVLRDSQEERYIPDKYQPNC